MASREQILTNMHGKHPIYEILLFEHPNKEMIGKSGKHLGWPDTGAENNVGFYYDLDDAIEAMHTNCCDIQERVYRAGFILCRREGLYSCVGHENRMYFLWDDTRGGFYETEEPHIFWHIAY